MDKKANRIILNVLEKNIANICEETVDLQYSTIKSFENLIKKEESKKLNFVFLKAYISYLESGKETELNKFFRDYTDYWRVAACDISIPAKWLFTLKKVLLVFLRKRINDLETSQSVCNIIDSDWNYFSTELLDCFQEKIVLKNPTIELIREKAGFAEMAGEGMVVWNLEGTLIYINRILKKMLGYSGTDLMNQNVSDASWIRPKYKKQFLKVFSDCIKKRKNKSLELELISKEKANYRIEINFSVISDSKGMDAFVIGLIINRSHYKDMYRESGNLIDYAPYPIIELDFSSVCSFLSSLYDSGVRDLGSYFDESPSKLDYCLENVKLINYNHAASRLFTYLSIENPDKNLSNLYAAESKYTFIDILSAIYDKKTEHKNEAVFGQAFGRKKYVVIDFFAVKGYEKNYSKVYLSITDISRIREAEKAHSIMEEKYRIFVEGTGDLITQVDKNGNYTFVNSASEKIIGILPEKAVGSSAFNSIHPEDREITIKNFNQWISKKRRTVEFENRLVNSKNGKITHCLWKINLYYDNKGNLTFINSIARDINEQKKSEKIINDQKKFLENVINSLPHPFYVIDVENYSVKIANKVAMKNAGTNALSCHTLIHGSTKKCKDLNRKCPLVIVRKTKKPVVVEHIRIDKNRNKRHYEIHGYPIFNEQGKVIQMIEYAMDISKRKKIEEEKKKLSEAVAQSPNSIILTDNNGNIEYANPSFFKLTGYKKKDAFGNRPNILRRSKSSKEINNEIWKSIKRGDSWSGEYCNKKKNGKSYWEKITISPIKDNDGKITNLLGIMEDITLNKKANEEINRLLIGINQASDSVVITDIDGNIKFVNPSFEKVTGYTKKEALNQNPRIIKSDIHEEKFYSELWDTILKGKIWNNEVINKKKNGELYTEEMTITPVKDENGKIINFVAIKRDISAKKELEEDINRLKREYEAFMRHEIKNALTPIQGYSEMLLNLFNKGLNDKQKQFIEKIYSNVKHTTEMIDYLKKLQDFEIGKFELDTEVTELKEMVENIINDFRSVWKEEDVQIIFNNVSHNTLVKVDKKLFPGVFTNLIKNAIEHIISLTDPEEKKVKIDMFNENEKVITKINNKGEPIHPSELKLFFEKFNSNRSKKSGGMGLGTTYAYLVTKAHKGDIFVESNEKDGTTITIKLGTIKLKQFVLKSN